MTAIDFLGQKFKHNNCKTCGAKYSHMSINSNRYYCSKCQNKQDGVWKDDDDEQLKEVD